MPKYAAYVRRAKELGARDAIVIDPKSVVTAEWVRMKCQFGCDGYGERLTCPPNSPTPERTARMLSEYNHALLIHVDDNSPVDRMVAILEKEMFFDGHHKAFAMSAGPCLFCRTCAPRCSHPEMARPSMESCGIDVFTTVRKHGLPIKVLNHRNCGHNYYGLVLIE